MIHILRDHLPQYITVIQLVLKKKYSGFSYIKINLTGSEILMKNFEILEKLKKKKYLTEVEKI